MNTPIGLERAISAAAGPGGRLTAPSVTAWGQGTVLRSTRELGLVGWTTIPGLQQAEVVDGLFFAGD